ncbi:WD40 repeat domain-containing protein [Streptomyces griseoluteus]
MRVVSLWDVTTGRRRATLAGHTNRVQSVAFSPDGQTLATGSDDQTARLWSVPTAKTRTTLAGHTGPVHSVALVRTDAPSPRAATTSRCWRVVGPLPPGEPLFPFPHT